MPSSFKLRRWTPVTQVVCPHKHELNKFNPVEERSKITQAHVYVWILPVLDAWGLEHGAIQTKVKSSLKTNPGEGCIYNYCY